MTRGRRTALFIVILVVLGILIVVGLRFFSALQQKKESTTTKEVAAVPVEMIQPIRGTIENYIVRNGDLTSKSTVQVFPKVPGKIISIPVSLGSKVGAGTILAVIDRDEPGFEFVRYRVESPISGEVAAILVNTGAYANTNTAIMTIIKPKDIKIVTNLTESDLTYVKLGQTVNVRPRNSANVAEMIPATISHIAPAANAMNRSWAVELTLTQMPANFRVGDYVSVLITTAKHENALLLPRACFNEKGNKWYIFTEENGIARQHFVNLGLSDENRFEVLDGVKDGDKVIILQGLDIQDGDKVKEATDINAGTKP